VSRSSRKTALRDLLGFEVGNVAYAIDIKRAREIVRPLPIVALPHLPAAVVGVADHRGDVVPVIDLRLRFGVQASGRKRDERLIVVTRGEVLVGLLVDRVTEVFGSVQAEPRDVPEVGRGPTDRAVRAAYSYGGRLVFVLDLDALTNELDELRTEDAGRAL
jgi:purine-binding chemotaxis protein CheW